jgi:hypothetical protein
MMNKPNVANDIRDAIKLLERAAFELGRPHAVKRAPRPKPRLIKPPKPRKTAAKSVHEEEL